MPDTDLFTDSQLTPSAKIAANAERGLKLRDQFSRGGTEVGVRRAHQLAGKRKISVEDLKAIYSYFARHVVDKRPGWDDPKDPSAGYIAWLLWGGDEAKTWVGKLHDKLEKSAD